RLARRREQAGVVVGRREGDRLVLLGGRPWIDGRRPVGDRVGDGGVAVIDGGGLVGTAGEGRGVVDRLDVDDEHVRRRRGIEAVVGGAAAVLEGDGHGGVAVGERCRRVRQVTGQRVRRGGTVDRDGRLSRGGEQ